MIYSMPIELYEERYTEQWARWWPSAFKDLELPFETVEGKSLVNKVEFGSVLDIYGTHYYKFTQLAKIVEMIRQGLVKNEDIIFVHDIWFPGIEALQYIRNMSKKKFQIWGIMHAGTWDKNDFTYKNGMRNWGQWIEQGWFNFIDKVFLGSAFHKQMILKNIFNSYSTKFIVSGLPFEYKEVVRERQKENIVVFPHRLDREKRPDLFDKLMAILKQKYENWQFIKTKEVVKSKNEYYELLAKSKIAVSFAEQETFGYAMLESIANKCIPVVPNRLSYSTMDIYDDFRYNTFQEALERIEMEMKYERELPKRTYEKLKNYTTKEVVKRIFLK